MPLLLYSWQPLNRRLGRPQEPVWTFQRERNNITPARTRNLDFPVHNLVSVLNLLSQSPLYDDNWITHIDKNSIPGYIKLCVCVNYVTSTCLLFYITVHTILLDTPFHSIIELVFKGLCLPLVWCCQMFWLLV